MHRIPSTIETARNEAARTGVENIPACLLPRQQHAPVRAQQRVFDEAGPVLAFLDPQVLAASCTTGICRYVQ